MVLHRHVTNSLKKMKELYIELQICKKKILREQIYGMTELEPWLQIWSSQFLSISPAFYFDGSDTIMGKILPIFQCSFNFQSNTERVPEALQSLRNKNYL